jgi:hypothetical protein
VSKIRLRWATGVLTSAALLSGGASAAGAAGAANSSATPPTLPAVQAKAAAAITLRLNDLNAAVSRVNTAKHLADDAATLDGYLQRDLAPLQALGQKIAADTNVTTAQADAATIFTNFRVLALVLPATRLAASSDSVAHGSVPNLSADSADAQAHVTAANQAALAPLIANLNDEISAATGATSGLAATVLADTPAQWNSDHSLLSSARASLAGAGHDVKVGRADVHQIRDDVKPSATPTTPTTS